MISSLPKNRRNRIGKKIKNDLIFAATKAVIAFAALIPLSWGLRLGAWVGRAAFALLGNDRKNALAHLTIAFPEKDESWRIETGRRSFMNLGRSFFELFHFEEILAGVDGQGRHVGYLSIEGEKHMAQKLREGRGALFSTGHCGNWELMAAYVSKLGYPVNTIVRRLYDQRIDKLLNEHRERFGYHPIWREGKAAMPEIVRVFQNNEFMGLLMDQDTKVRGVFVPFFGYLAHTPSGPAYLAYQADLDVLTAFIHRRPEGGHKLLIGPPVPRPKTGDQKADIREYTAMLVKSHEDNVRKYPEEWIWMHRRWKKRPEGEPPEQRPFSSRLKNSLGFSIAVGAASSLTNRFRWRSAGPAGCVFGKESGRNFVALAVSHRMNQRFFDEFAQVENTDRLAEAAIKGQNVLLAMNRRGAWEPALFAIAAMGYPVCVVENSSGRKDEDLWHVWARRRGQVLTLIDGSANSDQIDHQFKSGAYVAFFVEEANRTNNASEKPESLYDSLARLTRKKNVIVLPIRSNWIEAGRFHVVIEKSIRMDHEDQNVSAWTQAIHKASQVLASP